MLLTVLLRSYIGDCSIRVNQSFSIYLVKILSHFVIAYLLCWHYTCWFQVPIMLGLGLALDCPGAVLSHLHTTLSHLHSVLISNSGIPHVHFPEVVAALIQELHMHPAYLLVAYPSPVLLTYTLETQFNSFCVKNQTPFHVNSTGGLLDLPLTAIKLKTAATGYSFFNVAPRCSSIPSQNTSFVMTLVRLECMKESVHFNIFLT